MEKMRPYEKIIDGNEEQKKKASEKLQGFFVEKDEEFSKYELEKTPEDLEIIKKTEVVVFDIVKKYQGEPKEIPLDNIYIVKSESVIEISEGRLEGGIHYPVSLRIIAGKTDSKFLLASILAHESFHFQSPKVHRIDETGDSDLYRSGFSMYDKKPKNETEEKTYFSSLEEAIVAECTREFLEKIQNDPLFSEEVKAVNKIKGWVMRFYRRGEREEEKIKEFEMEIKSIPNPEERVEEILNFSENEEEREDYAAGMFDALFKDRKIEMFERYTERKKFYELLDNIVSKSDGKFKNRQEIFTEFAKANFTGRYLPIARIAEETLGQGSFRKIAEDFSVKRNNT